MIICTSPAHMELNGGLSSQCRSAALGRIQEYFRLKLKSSTRGCPKGNLHQLTALFSDADRGLCGCVMSAVMVSLSIYYYLMKNS